MGADGGSIAKRSELVAPVASVDGRLGTIGVAAASSGARSGSLTPADAWRWCALGDCLLEDPIVSDAAGALYNKKSVLEYLLGQLPASARPRVPIRQLRDVVELHRELSNGRWIDPLTRKDLAEEALSEAFGYIAQCGHVSSRAMLDASEACPVCEQSFDDYVILNPRTSDAELHNARRRERLKELGLSNSLRTAQRTAKRSSNKRDARDRDELRRAGGQKHFRHS